MAGQELLKQRDALKLKIAALEWVRDAPREPLADWLKAVKSVLADETHEDRRPRHEDGQSDDIAKLDQILHDAEALASANGHSERKSIIIATANKITATNLRQLRSVLEMYDQLLSGATTDLEAKIWAIIDSNFMRSRAFWSVAAIFVIAVAFAGFGTWQLYSGASSAGDLVNAMNARVMDAYTRIDAVTSNLDKALGEKLDHRLNEAVSDAKVEQTLTKVTDGVFVNRPTDIEMWIRQAIAEAVAAKDLDANIQDVVSTDPRLDEAIRRIADQNLNGEQLRFRTEEAIEELIDGLVDEHDLKSMIEQIVEPRIFASNRIDEAISSIVRESFEARPVDIRVEEAVKDLSQENLSEGHLNLVLKDIVGQRVDGHINPVMERIAGTAMGQRINELSLQINGLEEQASNLKRLDASVSDLQERLDPKFSPLSVDAIARSLRVSVVTMWVVTVGVVMWLIVSSARLLMAIGKWVHRKRAASGSA